MNKHAYILFHADFCSRMCDVAKKKNADYTGTSEDPFANFTKIEALGVCSTEIGFLTRMTDKLSRIASYVQQGNLQDKEESVTDTLMDLANYCALLAGYLQAKKEAAAAQMTIKGL